MVYTWATTVSADLLLQSTVHILHSTVYSLQSTFCSPQSTIHSLQSRVHSVQFTVYSPQSEAALLAHMDNVAEGFAHANCFRFMIPAEGNSRPRDSKTLYLIALRIPPVQKSTKIM